MIPTTHTVYDLALESGNAIFDVWRSPIVCCCFHAAELIVGWLRKLSCKRNLILVENVNDEVPSLQKRISAWRVSTKTPKHQGRI